MKKILCIAIISHLFLFDTQLVYSQNIDSLKLALKNATHDTARVKILSELSEICEPEDILKYAEPCAKLAEADAVNSKGIVRKLYLKHLANAFNNIGFVAMENGDNYSALGFYQKSLKIHNEIVDKKGLSGTLNNIGIVYKNQGDIKQALDYYHRSLKIQEELKDKFGIAVTLTNIGVIYNNQGDKAKALEYFKRSLNMQEEIKDKVGIARALNNIGHIYDQQGDIPRALDYFERSLKILDGMNDKKGIGRALSSIGAVYIDKGDIPTALEYLKRGLKIQEAIMDKKSMAYTLNNIGTALMKQGQLAQALVFVNRSLQTSKELGHPENIRNAASTLKNIYQKQNNYKQAFAMYDLEIQMRDSINNEETRKSSVKKQFQYQYEKKVAEDSVKNAELQIVRNAQLNAQQAQLKQEKTQRYALYGGLLVLIAFAGFVFNRFRITHRQKLIIEQQKVLVDKAYASLHEKNKEVMDSINYASRIQRALLTSEHYIMNQLNKLTKKN